MKIKTFIASILLLGIALINFSEALVINEHLMTKENPSENCIPPTSTNSFSIDDERAYSWLLFSGFMSGDRIDWEFYAPNNILYDTYAAVPPPFQPPQGCTWGWMQISPFDVPAGNWHIDVYVNNVYEFTENFTITPESPCPAKEIYGEDAIETELLRYFRDTVLSNTQVGQEIIRIYYEWSFAIVKAMEEDEEFGKEVKEMIDGVLPLIRGEVE